MIYAVLCKLPRLPPAARLIEVQVEAGNWQSAAYRAVKEIMLRPDIRRYRHTQIGLVIKRGGKSDGDMGESALDRHED